MTTPRSSLQHGEHTDGGDVVHPRFEEYILGNGLHVLLHPDSSVPVVNINVLYHVGSKDEEVGKTGFAHLFEHLMFDGSRNVHRGEYDRYCTMVGGENNAFTTSDVTNYHITLPTEHGALGLWLESDRMAGFAVHEDSLETQKNVVIEEKKQTQDDVPYGDVSVIMRGTSYDGRHPYSWDTMGSVDDIRGATMVDVRRFYERFYVPSRALLTIAGDFDVRVTKELVQTYFGDIGCGRETTLVTKRDPRPLMGYRIAGQRRSIVRDNHPFNAVFLGWHAPAIGEPDLRALDLLADVLAEGESSRLYRSLEYEQEIASEVDVLLDEGEVGSLLYIYAVGQQTEVTAAQLERAIRQEVERLATEGIASRELEKVINRKMTRIAHSLQSISSRAERLAWFASLYGDPSLAFREADLYAHVTVDDIRRVARGYLASIEPNVVAYELPD